MTDIAGPRAGSEGQAAARMADVVPQGRADVTGVICSARAMSIAGTPACRYTLTDGTGELDLLFLGRVRIAGMRCGRHCRAAGTVGKRDDRLVLWNPRYWLEPAGAPPDVLLVDDDMAIRRVLEVNLAARGYQVDVAATGAAAIELARREPGFVILDIGLPDMSGLAAISAIRAECDAPIIAISAEEAVATRAAALAAGASDYLSKPFAMDTLLAKVR
ncbi:MAG TPA: response regulator [Streptosporangiaceae bacterium]|jgi:CheY-like chemotaxis protein|nr:response regulator [Streptosporangiaceae bacterium]